VIGFDFLDSGCGKTRSLGEGFDGETEFSPKISDLLSHIDHEIIIGLIFVQGSHIEGY
jgi:hypothetical protein